MRVEELKEMNRVGSYRLKPRTDLMADDVLPRAEIRLDQSDLLFNPFLHLFFDPTCHATEL
jgi:hypothetical protein